MNKIDSKNKKFMIFGIIILVIAVVSSTLAYYIWSSGEQIKISTTVGGAYVYFDGVAEGKMTIERLSSAAQMITILYNNASKTAVINNSITYQYDTTHSLMKDVGDNIRYYGSSPNNYIYFNCSDYSNQSSSTCEIWRIIGAFDDKLKLMRNDSIGTIEYDNDKEDTYLVGLSNNDNIQKTNDLLYIIDTESKRMTSIKNVPGKVDTDDSGTNDYSVSSLQKILNNYYYNSKNYSGNSSYTFTNIGIKNDVTRNIISSNNYYLGGIQYGLNYYANEIYQSERSSEVYDGNATTWTGKIAIPYPSDYGYAVDLNKCSESLVLYNDTACISNSWISSMFTSDTWLLNPRADTSNQSSSISSNKVLPTVGVDSKYAVFPTLYLNSELSIKSGTGSSSDPYQLNV